MKKFLSLFVAAAIAVTPMNFTVCSGSEPACLVVAEETGHENGIRRTLAQELAWLEPYFSRCADERAEELAWLERHCSRYVDESTLAEELAQIESYSSNQGGVSVNPFEGVTQDVYAENDEASRNVRLL